MALLDKALNVAETASPVTSFALGPIGEMGNAAVRGLKAKRALDKLPDPRYTVAPQTLSFYDQAVRESIAPRGMSSIEKGAAYQDIAGITTGNIRNARRLGGGNIAGQINASLNNAGVVAATQLAGRDAAIRNSNRMNAYNRLQSTIPQFQNTLNQNVGLDIMKQQAFGGAVRDARMEGQQAAQNYRNQLTSIAGMAITGMPTGAVGGGPQKVGVQTGSPTAPQTPVTSPIPNGVQFTDYKPNAFNPYTFGFNSTGYNQQAPPQAQEQFVTTPYQPYGNEVRLTPYNSRRLGFYD